MIIIKRSYTIIIQVYTYIEIDVSLPDIKTAYDHEQSTELNEAWDELRPEKNLSTDPYPLFARYRRLYPDIEM